MAKNRFNRESMARWYARRHLKTDPGIQTVYYLPAGAPEREIRFIEVNNMIVDRTQDALEPIDFGVDIEGAERHTLMVLDVSPTQWEKISNKKIQLPKDWSLEGAKSFSR